MSRRGCCQQSFGVSLRFYGDTVLKRAGARANGAAMARTETARPSSRQPLLYRGLRAHWLEALRGPPASRDVHKTSSPVLEP